MGLERGEQHLIHISDVAGAHGKDHIPMVGSHGHHPGGKTHVFNRLNPLAGSRILDAGSSIHDGGRGNLREVLLLLTGRENAGDDDIIGLGQRLGDLRGGGGGGDGARALTCSITPASVMALTAILPIGVDSGSPSRRVSHFTRSLTVWMPLGLSAGTTRTGMCLTRSVLVAT